MEAYVQCWQESKVIWAEVKMLYGWDDAVLFLKFNGLAWSRCFLLSLFDQTSPDVRC